MTESPEDYELFHYGVKGMKWGVRRRSGESGFISNTRQKVRDRDENIKNARAELSRIEDEAGRAAGRYRATRSNIRKSKKQGVDRATRKANIRKARDKYFDEVYKLNDEAQKYFEAAQKKTSKEIAFSVAKSTAQTMVTVNQVVPQLIGTKGQRAAMANANVKMSEARAYNANARGISDSRTISLKPDDSRWG